MIEHRLTLITLGVADLGRSRRFYERLGWKASPASVGDIVFFQLNGIALALYPRVELAGDATVADSKPGFAGVTLAWNGRSKAEVDRAFASALAAGARAVKKPHDAFWGGYSGYFADPDGHLWELAWNPFFPLDARGDVSLTA